VFASTKQKAHRLKILFGLCKLPPAGAPAVLVAVLGAACCFCVCVRARILHVCDSAGLHLFALLLGLLLGLEAARI
jgi:hypothetical protein